MFVSLPARSGMEFDLFFSDSISTRSMSSLFDESRRKINIAKFFEWEARLCLLQED